MATGSAILDSDFRYTDRKGNLFRTRTELSIAEMLSFLDVKYEYDYKLALKDGKKAEVLKVLGDLPIMAQLALLEVISDEYVDLVVEDMKESYIHMNNFNDSDKEKGNGLTVMQVRYTIFTYLEVNKDDAVVGARYKKLIDALDPKAS